MVAVLQPVQRRLQRFKRQQPKLALGLTILVTLGSLAWGAWTFRNLVLRATALELDDGPTMAEEDAANTWWDRVTAWFRARTLSESTVSRYYSVEELSVSRTAARKGLDNTPTGSALTGLSNLCRYVLDPLNDAVQRWSPGRKAQVNSAYRAPVVNVAVGGSSNSDHPNGKAADIELEGLSNRQLAAWIIELGIPFDQLIWYDHKSHAHVSYRSAGENRGEILRATAAGAYIPERP